jgi:hypothetical protein
MDICRMKRPTIYADRIATSMWNAAGRVFSTAIAAALLLGAARADAAMVSGVYAGRDKSPAGHQLHFDNLVSGDIFLTRTGSDGSFAADLPPGSYDLRAEHGLVVVSKIVVRDQGTNLGRVGSLKPLEMIWRPFEGQGVGPALVNTSAPATAHVAGTLSSNDATPPQSAATFYTPGGQNPAPAAPPPQTGATFYAPDSPSPRSQ